MMVLDAVSIALLRPHWLWALPLALAPLWWLWRPGAGSGDWARVVDPALQPHVLAAAPGRAQRWPALLASLGLLLAVLALAGPAVQQGDAPLQRVESPLVAVVDLSARMRAADLRPSRIERVRLKLADLLRARRDGQIGIVVYAGDAYTLAPLSEDAAALGTLVPELDPGLMPVDGQRLDRALREAARLIRAIGADHGRVLVLTDRADAQAEAVAAELAASGIRTAVLGVGHGDGVPVPSGQGGFLRDAQGGTLLARLDPASLRALAAAGGGGYAELRADRSDLQALGVLEPDPQAQARADGDTRALQWRDLGPWLVLALLPLGALAFRRGWLAVLVLVPMLAPQPAQAFDWSALWRTPEQRAQAALEAGDADTAERLSRDPARQGTAAYRRDDFEAAARHFAAGDDARAHYNRGTALARAGQYEAALDAFDTALQKDPDLREAAANRDAVKAWLEQQADSADQPSSPQGEGGESQSGDGQSSGDGDPSEGAQDGPSAFGDGREQDGEAGEAGESQDGPPQSGESGTPQDGDAADGQPGEGEPDEQASDRAADQRAAAGEDLARELQDALDAAPAEDGTAGDDAGEPRPMPSPEEIAEQEQARALEQWLRRVPDDPGGLLRRKFLLEHQRRLREGRTE